jgi:glyoxylase-like metal-dependent hydrolase (beta-lactamase superfamily II)
MSQQIDRRHFMLGMLAAPLALTAAAAPEGVAVPQPGTRLPPWVPGCLDIHHIATGRGNATFVLMPDGSSLLIDAGSTNDTLDVSAAPKPNADRRPGEWIGRYVRRHLRAADRDALDYLLVTHMHPDHLGDVDDASPPSTQGPYQLSGVTDVAEMLPIGVLVDRGFPSYDFPSAPNGRYASNYLAFVRTRVQHGQAVERIRAGSDKQLVLRGYHAPGSATPFSIRNIAANGEVWEGHGDRTRSMFPPLEKLAGPDYPNENVCSIALRLSLGKFSYFTAGDLTSYTYDGDMPWRDVLTAAARAAGPASVATADHHGMFDGLSGDVVRALRPQAWVIPSWHIAHPDMLQLERMFSERLYPGPREVYATSLMRENYLVNKRLASRMRSSDGHVVIRVAPDGAAFSIFVTDNSDENDTIKLISKHIT